MAQYTIDVWQTEEGLPQNAVNALAQTPDGYLWLGTFDGLVRFDGMRFTVFHDKNTPGLTSSRVVQLYCDDQHRLWIVNEDGTVLCLADGRINPWTREGDLSPSTPNAVGADGVGELWWRPGARGGWSRVSSPRLDGPADPSAALLPPPGFLIEGGGGYWFNSVWRRTRLGQTNDPDRSQSQHAGPPGSGGFDCIARGRDGSFWLAGQQGLCRWSPGQQGQKTCAFPEPPGPLTALAEDSRGRVWVGTRTAGLFVYDLSAGWLRFTAGAGLAVNSVNCLLSGREGEVWVGTAGGGLQRFKPRLFRMYARENGLPGNVVMSVAEDREGRMWFGLDNGRVSFLQAGQITPLTAALDFRTNLLSCSALPDRQGALWIGLSGGSVLRYQAGEVTPYAWDAHALKVGQPGLFEDRSGAIWVRADLGLRRIHAGRSTLYTPEHGLSSDQTRALAEDRAGTLYIGTDRGLNLFQKGRFTRYSEAEGLPGNQVAALYVDADEALWIGTTHGGLSRFKDGRFARVTSRQGLSSDTIGSLVEDEHGNLWMGSNRGVFRARKEDLNELAEGRRRSVTCYAYGRSDGLSTLACATGGQPAACKARDGRLWFATAKGAAVVDPGNLPFNPLPPPVVIEECLIDDAVVAGGVSGTIGPWSSKSAVSGECRPTKRSALSDPPSTLTPIVVPPAKHRVEFRFTALSLVAPERVLFKYRLAGFDDDWVNAGPRRVAQYSYVPPGSYQFRVTACNNNGVWNDAGATLGLIVRPGWWQTGWFRVLAGVGLAGLVFLSYRRRVLALQGARATQQSFSRRLIESQENERKRLAAELHDSLGQNLLVIKNRALLGLQDASATAGALDQLDTISSVASQSLQEVREIAHNLRPCHLDRLGLTKALRAVITSVARASTIEFVPEIEVIDGLLLPEQEINLYRIVQELLNNIVKHSHAARARLGIRLEDRRLVLTFEDDGCGFDYAAATDHSQGGRGWGLAGIAERVRILGGNLRCDSSPGRGTRWAIDIPVPPARNISQSAVEHEPNRPDSRGN